MRSVAAIAGRNALLWAAIPLAILSGVALRFYHLDHKVLWDDEIYSEIRIIGATEQSVILAARAARSAADLQAILNQPAGDERTPLALTVKSLANEDPQHPPAYFVIAHGWAERFGRSLASMRALSAVIGVLALPVMFWLCFELYGSRQAGWIGTALVATSPVAVLYSQEVRDYGLWMVATLLTSGFLLRAIRLRVAGAWCAYLLALTFSLYVCSLSLLTAVGFATYAIAIGRRSHVQVTYALLSLLGSLLLFSPWMRIVLSNLDAVERGAGTVLDDRYPVGFIIRKFLGSARLNYFDYDVEAAWLSGLFSIATVALVVWAFVAVCRTRAARDWGFVLALWTSASVPLVVHDVIFGGMLTAQTRYLIPAFVAADIAIVGLFAGALSRAHSIRATRGWTTALFAVLALRVSSCAASSVANTWWNKFDERSIAVAARINAGTRPLLVSDAYIGYILSVAEYLRPEVVVSVRPTCYICRSADLAAGRINLAKLIAHSSDVFALGPSEALQKRIRLSLVGSRAARYTCVDVRKNCPSPIRLWRWVE